MHNDDVALARGNTIASWEGLMLRIPLLLLIAVTLSGCAALTSVWWSTDLPAKGDSGSRAVHLDAKQRLALAKGGDVPAVCAEPSPDALSAFASAIGLGIVLPNQASASLAQALQETSASIGLRTQSITLMRDSMYRLCEAYFNRAINQPQMVSLLARSQDLTVTVLAIEQLTGAVVANQVGLGGTANASASANLVGNQQLLDAARANQAAREADQKAAQADLDKKLADKKTATDDLAAVQDKLRAIPPPSDDEKAKLQAQEKDLTTTLTNATSAAASAQKLVDTTTAQVAEAARNVEVTQNNRTAALTQATATASGSVTFGNARQTMLSDGAVEKVATAVKGIVDAAMTKSYTEDNCFALLSGAHFRDEASKPEHKKTVSDFTDAVLSYCKQFIDTKTKELVAKDATKSTR